ncbi:MAG: CoA activase [Spirochaetaceae bacterium]|nr:MAG: CoA activase [Spirochaetaceae bacterium]
MSTSRSSRTGSSKEATYLGIDIGSVSVSVIQLTADADVVFSSHEFHAGNAVRVLRDALCRVNLDTVVALARTSLTPDIVPDAEVVDATVAILNAVKARAPETRTIILIGGERYARIDLSADGGYVAMHGNSSCAAGTGSFLDQQARRLSLSGPAELARRALGNTGTSPSIASRCSVFAKTDLVHAQQDGYSVDEICDGLCRGLARNIVDTLGLGDADAPVLCVGGVSLNAAVVAHIESLTGHDVSTDEFGRFFGAFGAALHAVNTGSTLNRPFSIDSILAPHAPECNAPALELALSEYPDFSGIEQYRYRPERNSAVTWEDADVEVTRYVEPAARELPVRIGIDIGSTSTKAIATDVTGQPVAGFYTRTAGRPIVAVQSILAAVRDLARRLDVKLTVLGVATTGSGRKFVGAVVGADLILDEITAHARAAVEIDPEVDTIIEIGGQDAKFTTLRDGIVTFCHMNTVCAAGTGSFIEEQANRVGVPLDLYAETAFGARSPRVSDRCTVFMERDINRYVTLGFSKQAILAAALHSVCDNYLQKVASEGSIGRRVCFQGATAKNKALVAAFEQRLNRPITVSKYCHLAGAYGAAIVLAEEHATPTTFRGFEIADADLVVSTETCELCANSCRIRVTNVGDDRVAYGFLCGRDYDTYKRIDRKTTPFVLANERARIVNRYARTGPRKTGSRAIGLPTTMYMYEDQLLWRRFFAELGVPVAGIRGSHREGNAGTVEFCAPIGVLHAEIDLLTREHDFVFLPHVLATGDSLSTCYYTQMMPAVMNADFDRNATIISPLIAPRDHATTVTELFESLQPVLAPDVPIGRVAEAYETARDAVVSARSAYRAVYKTHRAQDGIAVALLGRPYLTLSPAMNNGIPRLFEALGVPVFYQDMLPRGYGIKEDPETAAFHWTHARRILDGAAYAARTPNLYPVLVTAFKCSPDAFVLDFFTSMMERRNKPYLILQLDALESGVGYETRIEAAVRAFRNDCERRVVPELPDAIAERDAADRDLITAGRRTIDRVAQSVGEAVARARNTITGVHELHGKVVLFPNWDAYTGPFLVEILRANGVDAHLLEEDAAVIASSMRHNTGQCLPVNVIAEETMAYVERHSLEPGQTILWVPRSEWGCNIPLFPAYTKNLFARIRGGFEEISVYAGDMAFFDISPLVTIDAYFAYVFGGLLRRLACHTRPYEIIPGATDQAVWDAHAVFLESFRGKVSREDALEHAVHRIEAVPRIDAARPKVAIFGDIYARDNDVMNQDLIRTIESAGGEVVTTPYSEYARIVADAYFRRILRRRKYGAWLKLRSALSTLELLEKHVYRSFEQYLPRIDSSSRDLDADLSAFGLRIEQSGETVDNVLKILHIVDAHPDMSLLVQAAPAFCCPSLVTEALARKIEQITGVPIVSITYDGTGTPKNDVVIPYVSFARPGVHVDT